MSLGIERIEELAEYPAQRAAQIFMAACAMTRQRFGVMGQPSFTDCQRRKCNHQCPHPTEFPKGWKDGYRD